IDIMEVLGNNPSELYTTVHSGTPSAEISSGKGTTVADTSAAFHTFAVDWTPSTLTWYFDGQQVFQTATPAALNIPMYLEVNLAMGGGWPGNIDSTTSLPAQMRVAYVQAYSSNPNPITTSAAIAADGTAGQLLIGAPGNDVFYPGTNSVVMTGEGQTNTYIYTALPTQSGHITDFDPTNDTINLSGLLGTVGYTGSDPFGDGTLSLASDGHGGTDLQYDHNGNATVIVDLDHVGFSALTGADFIVTASGGASSDVGAGMTNLTLTADNSAGQILTATSPTVTFDAGQNSVVMTGDGGSNTYVWDALPYNAAQITDFNPASDTINVATLLHAAGYSGSNPFGDGTLSLASDGNGGTNLMYNPPGAGSNGIWPTKIVDIDHVAQASLSLSKDFILH
ncbi:MAG: family 16 glycosylhydrolase, partial [Rhizomicrobium sp.]